MAERKVWIACVAALVALLGSTMCVGSSVVINEVAWSGTAASSSDEWIELHNPTEAAIDLMGWTVVFGNAVIHLGEVDGATVELRRTVIEAGGYLLLERTDDDTLSDVPADVLYAGALGNDGIVIELRNAAGDAIDVVELAETGWPAGTGSGGEPAYASMERVDPAGNPEWKSNDGVLRNGLDKEGNPLNGTPGRENSALVLARTAPQVDFLSAVAEGDVLSGVIFLQWSATDPDGSPGALRIAIELSIDGGETWTALAANLANSGSYAWDTVTQANTDEVRVRIVAEDSDGRRGSAMSPAFTIRNQADSP